MKRNKFSLSHYKLLTCDMGELVPIACFEVLPGDTIQQLTACLLRVSPLLSPVMHPVRVRLHHWFVPIRLIWEDWEDFITGGADGTSVPDHPILSLASVTEGTLLDYLGITPDSYSPNLEISALPVRAYQLIFNSHYRDQDLVTEAALDTASGTDSTTSQSLQKIAWEKDYFTTSRPWTDKGDVVTIPLGDSAPITGFGVAGQTPSGSSGTSYETDGTGSVSYANYWNDAGNLRVEQDPNNVGFPNIRADLGSATGIDINDLRLAVAIQKYQEARAKYGSRYVEYLRYLGVRPSDARLQNPEYLGGGRQVIQFSEVLSTDGSNTGDMKGHGISALRSGRYRRFMEEHGFVMTLMSVVPKAIYTESLHRSYLRLVKEDYFQRELQTIGEQEITNREAQINHSSPSDVFGYQARYDEYRSMPSNIAGEFRSTLDHWHYGRIYSGDIALNSSWVTATPTKRVNASSGTDCLYVMANHSIQARRLIHRVARSRL